MFVLRFTYDLCFAFRALSLISGANELGRAAAAAAAVLVCVEARE
jgi:hypothetical protein